MDAVTLTKDELLHLRVPTTRLMAEVNARFQQLLYRNSTQTVPPNLSLRELISFSGAGLTIRRTLRHARVAGQKSCFLKLLAKFGIKLEESSRDSQADGSCLSR